MAKKIKGKNGQTIIVPGEKRSALLPMLQKLQEKKGYISDKDMLHIAFHGLDKVRNEVVAAFKLYVDLRPGIFNLVTQAHQGIENGNEPDHQDQDDAENN